MFASASYAVAGPSSSQSVQHDPELVCALCNNPFVVVTQHTLNTDPQGLHLFRRTKCGHKLHTECMNQHLPNTKRCPVCNTPIKWKDIINKCVLCLDPLHAGESVHQASCRHKFHLECITHLLQIKDRCPICRRRITYYKTVSNAHPRKTAPTNGNAANQPQTVYTDSLSDYDSDDEDYIYFEHEGVEYRVRDEGGSHSDGGNSVDHDEFDDEVDSDYIYDSCDEGSDDVPEDNVDTICAICNIRFSETQDKTRLMRCGHTLHVLCMDSYLPAAKKCPICRAPVKWIAVSNKCVVCLDFLSLTEDTKTLSCDHECHSSCLSQWMSSKTKCPICKRKIVSVVKECVICLEDIRAADVLKKLSCQHEFHNACVTSWLLREKSCPLCRKNVVL